MFSDMLGYHSLVALTDIYSRLIDSTALVGYQNSRHRLNWGAVAMRIPYVYGWISGGFGTALNRLAYIEQEYIYRQIDYQLSAFTAYPFNQLQRFELSAGLRLIDFQQVVYTRAYDYYDNFLFLNDKQTLPSPPSLKFATTSAALVYDSAFFGATSPLIGQSYRFEVAPYMGSINFSTILADYRRYFMPIRPFTLAFRLLHYGRYGEGAEDSRLYPLFLGYEYFIRGYDYYSFSSQENFNFERLWGSRMLVANAELRFPLFNVLGIGRGFYGILPIEFVAFYDAGTVWWKGQNIGHKNFLESTGIGLRMNVLGYIILGVNYVKPFDRPNSGWRFQISLIPGF